MLLELRIQNFAVIEQLSIHLESGLNALTGETGAGKSIIVGALGLLLGERASGESIRAGAQKAVVEGVFDVANRKDILKSLAEQGIEANEGLLILRREVAVGAAAVRGSTARRARPLCWASWAVCWLICTDSTSIKRFCAGMNSAPFSMTMRARPISRARSRSRMRARVSSRMS